MFKELLSIIKNNPVRSKILLQPASMAGKILVDRICREQGGVINLRPMTVQALAMQVAELEMASQGLCLLPEGGGSLIVQSILPSKGYYNLDKNMPGLADALWTSLEELRMAGIEPDQIKKTPAEPSEKVKALAGILEKVENELKKNNLTDWAGILRIAIQKAPEYLRDSLLIIPGDLALTGLEKVFIDSLQCQKVATGFHIDADIILPEDWQKNRLEPAHSAGKTDATAKELQKNVSFFLASYFDAEIIEVIRRIFAAELGWETVEICISSPSAQAATVFSLLDTHEIAWAAAFPRPVTDYRIGRAAENLCRWAAGGFKADFLLSMLAANEIRLFPPQRGNHKDEIPGTLKVATLIRDSHAVGGRDGYSRPLEELRKIKEEHDRTIDEEQLLKLQQCLKKILAYIPEQGSPADFARGFAGLFNAVVFPSGGEEKIILDQMIIKRVSAMCEALSGLQQPMMSRPAAMQWLNNLLVGLRISEGKNFAGRVLITSPGSHGLSGRPFQFFVGLNHSAIPGLSAVDPILNEEFRLCLQKNGHKLRTNEDLRLEKLVRLKVALASLPEKTVVCLSASQFEQDKRASSLTTEFIRIVKCAIDNAGEKTLDDLCRDGLVPVLGYRAENQAKALDLNDFLRIHAAVDPELKMKIFSEIMPSAKRYQIAQKQRVDGSAALITGLPDWDPEKYDYRKNGKAVSASYITSLSGCTLMHFYREVLRCMPYDHISWQEASQDHWLDHLQRGSLLHEVFELFMREAGWPIVDSHKPLLDTIVRQVIEKYQATIPAPDLALFKREVGEIENDAACFFELEKAAAASGYKPVGFEVAFGMGKSGADAPESKNHADRPVEFCLADGSRIFLRGRIDRIDKGPAGLRIVDYKTGRSDSYQTDPEKIERSELQLAIYAEAGKELVRRQVFSGELAEACLYFPTARGEGYRLAFDVKDPQKIIRPEEHLELFKIFADGTFTPDVSDECRLCNAVDICPFMQISLAQPEDVDAGLNNGEEE